MTGLSEFPGLLLAVVLVDLIGRKPTLALTALGAALSTGSLYFCGADETVLVIGLFLSRGMWICFNQGLYLYTPEAYPTNLRAVATGNEANLTRRIISMSSRFNRYSHCSEPSGSYAHALRGTSHTEEIPGHCHFHILNIG